MTYCITNRKHIGIFPHNNTLSRSPRFSFLMVDTSMIVNVITSRVCKWEVEGKHDHGVCNREQSSEWVRGRGRPYVQLQTEWFGDRVRANMLVSVSTTEWVGEWGGEGKHGGGRVQAQVKWVTGRGRAQWRVQSQVSDTARVSIHRAWCVQSQSEWEGEDKHYGEWVSRRSLPPTPQQEIFWHYIYGNTAF